MEAKEISKAVIKRLPRYYRYLGELMEENVERISSNDLSKKMHVTASQIRQDLNNFGGFGQQGYGYNVRYLYTGVYCKNQTIKISPELYVKTVEFRGYLCISDSNLKPVFFFKIYYCAVICISTLRKNDHGMEYFIV